PLPVGRPRRTEVAAGPRRQRPGPPRLEIENPDISGAAGTGGHKCELLAVGGERRLIVVPGVVGQTLEPSPIGLDAKQIGRPLAAGREHNGGAIGPPDRVVVRVGVGEERMFTATVARCDIQPYLTWAWKD